MTPASPLDGATPLDDLSGLKVRSITTRGQLDVAEAENIRLAHVKYLASRPGRRAAPFDARWMKKLHREMFGKVWRWAGEPRRFELNLGVAWTQIEPALLELEQTLAFYRGSTVPLLEQATRLHHRSVQIHPFPNGNGRWGRLLANIWLKQAGREPTAWPEVLGGKNDVRREYLAALRGADQGDLGPLLGMQSRFTPA
ncbi:MAG: mobile mystery protein B [Planctomycetes bacterium]|nr:mobile mystery protein B [Planctomycetota bacterium]